MNGLKLVLISVASVIMFVIFGVFFVNGYQNNAYMLEEQVKVAYSDIEVQEKRRVDLIYNLVDTVKYYAEHEAETLQNVIEARANGKGDISEVNTLITSVAEAYPELKANENYKTLMNELSVTENLIAQYRSNYNKQVKEYNRFTKQFPNKQMLNLLGYEREEFGYLNYDAPSDAPSNLFGTK